MSDTELTGESALHRRHDQDFDIQDDVKATPSAITAQKEFQSHYIHPEAAKLFGWCPWTTKIPLFHESAESYGPRCTIALGLCYLLSKGLANAILGYAQLPMMRDRFGVEVVRYQRLAAISKMSWSVKCLIALLSDSFATFGYTKRWYCAASCLVGGVVCIIYALLPKQPSSGDIAAGMIFLAGFCMANIDILSEGHYSRLMRQLPGAGPALVSWIYWFITGAGIIGAAIQGPISDKGIPQVGVYVSAGAQFLTTIFFIFNWYGEKVNRIERNEDIRLLREDLSKLQQREDAALGEVTTPPKNLHPEVDSDEHAESNVVDVRHNYLDDDNINDEGAASRETSQRARTHPPLEVCIPDPDIRSVLWGAIEFNRDVCVRNLRLLILCVYMTACVITMACVTIFASKWILLYVSIAVFVTCVGAILLTLPRVVAYAAVELYCAMLFYLQIPGALDNYYTADPTCVPDGPHFSYTFYHTVAQIIGNVAGIVGVGLFPYLFAKHSYRFTLNFTTMTIIVASLFDIVIVKRWNVTVGIPDHAMYIMGDAIIYEVCYMLNWVPMVILISRVCPRGSESMVYAIVASFGNMGASMSNTVGSLIIELRLPVKSTLPCDFSNTWLLILIGHICMPLLILPLTYLLMPSTRICDDIDVEKYEVKKVYKPKAAQTDDAPTTEPYGNGAMH